jgi:hypothetical protein
MRARRSHTGLDASQDVADEDLAISIHGKHNNIEMQNDHQIKHLHRSGLPRNICRTGPQTVTSIRVASATAIQRPNLQETQSGALVAALNWERGKCGIDHVMGDDAGPDDLNDEDYGDMSDIASSAIDRLPHSRKRSRQTTGIKDKDVVAFPTHPLNRSCQVLAATSPLCIQDSE